MNTVSRLDTYLTALLVPALPSPPSTRNARASSSKVTLDSPASIIPGTGASSISSLPDVTETKARPSRRPSSPTKRGRSRRRRKPTTSSIKLPPPSTPFFLRIALGLWSILLSFWMSLVGEIRAERAQRRKRRRVRTAASGASGAIVGGGHGARSSIAGQDAATGMDASDEPGGAIGMGGMSSDEGSGTEMDGEGEGEHDGDQDGESQSMSKSDKDDGWVDPVTRAPAGMGDEIDTPGEDEFAEGADTSASSSGSGAGGSTSTSRYLHRTYSPSLATSNTSTALSAASGGEGGGINGKAEPDAVTFRLRSAERRHRDSLPASHSADAAASTSLDTNTSAAAGERASDNITPSGSNTTHNLFPSVHINPPTPPKLVGAFQPSSILTNPSHPASLPPYHPSGSGAEPGAHRRTDSGSSIPSRPASPTRTRSNRLLANPISTSLLDPSKPASSLSSLSFSTSYSSAPASIPRLRPHTTPFHLQKTLILDLDETLIHSTSRPMAGGGAGGGMLGVNLGALLGGRKKRREGHTVEVVIGGRSTTYHVYKRPYVDLFLKKVATWYTLVIYTASMPEYADPVIDWLDAGRSLFAKRLYRDSCFLQTNGSYIKDLALVEKDLSRVCFMDNSPISYAWNKANALPIEGWTSDPYDEALLQSLPVLDCLRFVNDVRRILGIRGFF